MFVAVAVFASLVALGLVFLEMHLRARRTQIIQVPGGLRFEAQKFSMQLQRTQREVRVQCARGVLTPGAAGSPARPAGPVECQFAAAGFRVEVRESVRLLADQAAPVRTGFFEISLRGADGMALRIPQVNAAVAADFVSYFRQVGHWIDKLEQLLERERVAQLRAQEEAAQTRRHAELMESLLRPTDAPPSPADCEAASAAQIAHWRQAAGFRGQHSLWQADSRGVIHWFVDLAMDGRITLHANKRTLHGSLRGASITSTGEELHMGLRDAHWTEEEPELRFFRVLRGRKPEERLAWKERMESIRNGLSS